MDKRQNRRHKDFSTSDFYRNNSWKKNRFSENKHNEKPFRKQNDFKFERNKETKFCLSDEYALITSKSFSWLKNTLPL